MENSTLWDIEELNGNSENRSTIIEDIVKMEKKIFPKHESVAKTFDDELKKKNSGLLYSITANRQILGYVMYSWPSSLSASITKLAVKENFRKQGIGEALALLRAAIRKCQTRNVQRVSLHVDPVRASAVNLYIKLGFQVDRLIEGYYSSYRNAYRMYLDFNT